EISIGTFEEYSPGAHSEPLPCTVEHVGGYIGRDNGAGFAHKFGCLGSRDPGPCGHIENALPRLQPGNLQQPWDQVGRILADMVIVSGGGSFREMEPLGHVSLPAIL